MKARCLITGCIVYDEDKSCWGRGDLHELRGNGHRVFILDVNPRSWEYTPERIRDYDSTHCVVTIRAGAHFYQMRSMTYVINEEDVTLNDYAHNYITEYSR